MTKQEAIEKTKKMLGILIGLPDSETIDIISCDENSYFFAPTDIRIHLRSGIEEVEKSIEDHIVREYRDNEGDVHRSVQSTTCEYVQIFTK